MLFEFGRLGDEASGGSSVENGSCHKVCETVGVNGAIEEEGE